MTFPITTLVIFLPLIGAVVTMLARSDQAVRYAALATTTVTFLLSLLFWAGSETVAHSTTPAIERRSSCTCAVWTYEQGRKPSCPTRSLGTSRRFSRPVTASYYSSV